MKFINKTKLLKGVNCMWHRYVFKTKAINDYRPLIFNPKYPWWCSGEGDGYVTIVAYLPVGENIYKYWDDAYHVHSKKVDKIEFTDRFPKPNYFIEDDANTIVKNIRRIDDLGRIVITKDIRKYLGINEGDKLDVDVDTSIGKIIISRLSDEEQDDW